MVVITDVRLSCRAHLREGIVRCFHSCSYWQFARRVLVLSKRVADSTSSCLVGDGRVSAIDVHWSSVGLQKWYFFTQRSLREFRGVSEHAVIGKPAIHAFSSSEWLADWILRLPDGGPVRSVSNDWISVCGSGGFIPGAASARVFLDVAGMSQSENPQSSKGGRFDATACLG